MSRFLIIPAAGSGRRIARREPKALVPLRGRPILGWTLENFSSIDFEQIVVAAPPDRERDFQQFLGPRVTLVRGGATRAASVRAAFRALEPNPADLVVIHDAARPFVTPAEVDSVISAAQTVGAAIAATPIVDTVKKGENGRVVATLDRDGLYAAGTPQVFRADVLARALASGREETDEASLCEFLGLPVALVPVSRLGFKITTPEDLELAEAILKSHRS